MYNVHLTCDYLRWLDLAADVPFFPFRSFGDVDIDVLCRVKLELKVSPVCTVTYLPYHITHVMIQDD